MIMAILKQKYISKIKYLIILLLILPILPLSANMYLDTVNIRKAFFLYEQNWNKFVNKIHKKIDGDNKVGFICKIENGCYELLFYIANDGWDDFYSCGRMSYMFNKDKELLKVKVYFQKNNNSYLYFDRDNPNKLDIYLFGKLYMQDIPYYYTFEALKILPINTILKPLSLHRYDNEVIIDKSDKSLKLKFIDTIITPSLGFDFVNDGARNKFGKFVFIENGEPQSGPERGFNCSGFVKDVADNYIRLFEKNFTYLEMNTLKERRLDERHNFSYKDFEYEYDPFFGFDWALNTMDQINTHCGYNIIKAEEINDDTFFNYQQYYGYKITELKELLFRDQKKDSTYFYIVTFNKLRTKPPILNRFYHLAIIVPYFHDHHFYLRVFESGEETNFGNLLKNHKDGKVIVIRVPIPIEKL